MRTLDLIQFIIIFAFYLLVSTVADLADKKRGQEPEGHDGTQDSA